MVRISITHRTVEHNDPKAAGFTDGWWYAVQTRTAGLQEGANATRAGAEAYARQLVHDECGPGPYPEVEVVHGDELMPRTDDEQRVRKLLAGSAA